MKRIKLIGIHNKGGKRYEWLLPECLTDSFLKKMKKAQHCGYDLLALVENKGVDCSDVAIVKIVDARWIKNKAVFNKLHPYASVLNLFVGYASNFIPNFTASEIRKE